MPRIDPEGRLTRRDRLATVLAVAGAVVVHVVLIFGWGRIYQWAEEVERKERLMVIRRVRELAPPRERPPEPSRPRQPAMEAEGRVGDRTSPPPPQDARVKEQGEEPPEEELSTTMEEEVQERADEAVPDEHADNTISVVTDLGEASFSVAGREEFRGSGRFWMRKGAPPGRYTATFHPVAGYTTPAIQIKELVDRGQITFVGKYKRSIEVVVDSNVPAAQVTIYRPDGKPIELNHLGQAMLEDLPAGRYTAVFKDVPGYITPAPVVRNLAAGGKLSFFGEYRDDGTRGAGGGGRGGTGTGTGLGLAGSGKGGGGVGRAAGARMPPSEPGLDRRVSMVVQGYLLDGRTFDPDWEVIPYPDVIIRRSNFQKGWCQVYLIIMVNDQGRIERIDVERPSPGERAQFEAMIAMVEGSVRRWDYDKVRSEVHVDVRFLVE